LKHPTSPLSPLHFIAAVAAIALLASSANAQFSADERKCRQTIAKNGSKLIGTLGKTLSGCHKNRLKGKVMPVVDCNNVAAADAKGKIAKAEGKFRDAVGGAKDKCIGLSPSLLNFYQCPAPCDVAVPAITSFADVAECAICTAENSVAAMEAAGQGSPVPPLGKAEGKCHGTIGKNQTKHLATILKERTKCQGDAEKLGATSTSSCSGVDPKGKIAKARAKTEAGIAKSCSAADLNAVSSCSTVGTTELSSCLLDDSDVRGEALFQSLFGFGTPTWTAVTVLFGKHGCNTSLCHGVAANSGGLTAITDFDIGYTELVGAPVECFGSASTTRVVPFDASTSFLIAKLEGTQDCGSTMPLGGSPLPQADIDVITAWILDGAQKN